jgi:hypothetical protein
VGAHNEPVSDRELHAFEHDHEMEHEHELEHELAQHSALKVRLARLELLVGLGATKAGSIDQHLPAWLRRTRGEPRLPVAVAVLVAVGLQVGFPGDIAFQPRYLLPIVELALFAVLFAANPRRITRESPVLRLLAVLLLAIASFAVAWSAGRLVWQLARGGDFKPLPLLLTGGAMWLTNVIVFALWYWDLDRGGPAARAAARVMYPDFLFSQMTAPELVRKDWEPGFVDYLYLSFTNATAFSPTDTLPLSRWAKLMMMFQSGISLVTVALVVARAVNILK